MMKMYSELRNEFGYSIEQIDLLKKLFKEELESILETFEKALNHVKVDRNNYIDEKKQQREQGKAIRLNRRQKLEKWNNIKQNYFIRNLSLKNLEIHHTHKRKLLRFAESHYTEIVTKIYEDEGKPYDQKQAHEFFRQMPVSVQNSDISFLEYDYSSNGEYELYIDDSPYLVWMGSNKMIKRDEQGKPVYIDDEFQYRETDTYVVVQRFYHDFYWVVSSYEAKDTRAEKKRQFVEDFISMIGQEPGAKTVDQISREIHEYMWLSPFEIESVLTLSAMRFVDRYRDDIHQALERYHPNKPSSGRAQQEFANPLTLGVRYP